MDQTILIVITLFGLFYTIWAEDEEFYCKIKKDKWQVCRRCDKIGEKCDGTSLRRECKCDNIKISRPGGTFETTGGPDNCENQGKDGGWCYVLWSDNDICSDQEFTFDNDRFTTDPEKKGAPSYIWLQPGNEFAKSKKACETEQNNIGNEPVLEGIRIKSDFLKIVENLTATEELKFYMDSSDECKRECETRVGTCGAWSFDTVEYLCHLHTVDSCCGLFGKREDNSDYTSGYVCRQCWSTKAGTECPCPAKERTEKPNTEQAKPDPISAAKEPLHQGPTGLLSVHGVEVNPDLCECERRHFRRGRSRKPVCRCVQPQCHDAKKNKDGKCLDRRRCRERRLDLARFPPC